MNIQSVGLWVNRSKGGAVSFSETVHDWLVQHGCSVVVEDRPTAAYADSEHGNQLAATDLIITLGGDGTILAASRVAAPNGIPILGVHMGQFGFIAESHPDDLLEHLPRVLAGEAAVEERMMVRGDVVRGGECIYSATGLNDIVVNKGAMTRLLTLQTSFGEDFVASYPADGVVVATPTGSTAYAMSAGGPLIEPTVQALLVAPICPHTLSARPLVVPADERVSFTLQSDGGEILLSADSVGVFRLMGGDRVEVLKAEHSTRIVALRRAGFYRKIRKRLLWGERLNTD